MRITFLDEAGTSQKEQEPFAVVAGVILYGDEQVLDMEIELEQIVATFPDDHVKKRYIHAAKLYGGYGEFGKKRGWDVDARFRVLDAVAALFEKHEIAVVWGACEKSTLRPSYVAEHRDEHQAAHVLAAANCTLQVERFMREFCEPKELTWIVAENNTENRDALKKMHRFFANLPLDVAEQYDFRWAPLTKIRGTPSFEDKEDASHLQLADFCAFVVKRQLMRDQFIERLFGPLRKRFAYGRSKTPNDPMFDPWLSA